MSSPKVYISILNWNGINDTLECLESVFSMNYKNYNVIVVDNNSSDNSVQILRKTYPNLHIIQNKQNSGFTGGNNIVIDFAIKNGAKYVWLLNNDTVVGKNSLKNLVELGESSDSIGMISPIIYYYTDRNRKQFSGSKVNWKNMKVEYPDLKNVSMIDHDYINGANVCLWGTALLIKTEIIKKVGQLKNEYFAYWEDTEYSFRVLKAGYRNVVDLNSHIFHKSPLSGVRNNEHYYYYMVRNRMLLIKEYVPIQKRFIYYWEYLSELFDLIGKLQHIGINHCANVAINGYYHGYKNIVGPMKDPGPTLFKYIVLFLTRKHPHFMSNLMLGNLRIIIKHISQKILFLK